MSPIGNQAVFFITIDIIIVLMPRLRTHSSIGAARSHKRPFWSLSPHLARVEVAAQRGLWKRFCPLCRAAGPLRVFNKRSKYGLLPYFKYSYRQELNGLQSTALLCGFGFSPAKPLPLGASSTCRGGRGVSREKKTSYQSLKRAG